MLVRKKKRGLCVSPFKLFSREVIALEIVVEQMGKKRCPSVHEMIQHLLPLYVLKMCVFQTCNDGENRKVKCACVNDLYLYEHQIKRTLRGKIWRKGKKKEKGATAV